MKNDLRILRILLPAIIAATCPQKGHAQSEPGRPVIVIDYFSSTPDIPVPALEAIRSQVLQSFVERGQHETIDAETASPPPASSVDIRSGNPAAILDIQKNIEEAHREAIEALNARFILSGHVSQYTVKRELLNGKPRFASSLLLVLSGTDTANGREIPLREFRFTGRSEKPQEADRLAVESQRYALRLYIESAFPFETGILRMEEPDKKGKYKELYIHCGSSMGIQNGDLFLVFVETDIAGEPIRKQIGKLRAKEVLGEAVTRCKITSGGEAIAEAFENARTLIVQSNGEAFF